MTPHHDGIDALAEELDLLAFPILTGTLKTSTPPPMPDTTPVIKVGDYILNVRPLKGTTDQHTVMNGRITHINERGCAYENNRYLGRINGGLGWVTSIVEPHQLLPQMHNSLIVITRIGGITVEIPAIYNTHRSLWQNVRTYVTAQDQLWIQPSDIQGFRHAKVVAL